MAAQVKVVTTTQTIELKGPSEWAVGRWIVTIYKSAGAGTFTAKPQRRGRIEGNPPAGITLMPYADCWYNLALTGADVAAGTTQTATCMMDVDGSGSDVQVVLTLSGANTIMFYATPLAG